MQSAVARAIEFLGLLAAAVTLICTGHQDWIMGLVVLGIFLFSI